MDKFVLKSLWKMWITTCRKILLFFLCKLLAWAKMIKNQNNEEIFTNFLENSVQMTKGFWGRNLLTSGGAEESCRKLSSRNERRLAVIRIVLLCKNGGEKGKEIVLTLDGNCAIISKVLCKCWCSSVGRASHS